LVAKRKIIKIAGVLRMNAMMKQMQNNWWWEMMWEQHFLGRYYE